MLEQNHHEYLTLLQLAPTELLSQWQNTFAFQLEFNYKIINSAKIQESFGTCACLIPYCKSFLLSLHWLLLAELRSYEAPHPFPFSFQLHYISQIAG